uniref:Uncharacterized protein n=1 Tax=Oncorhynchus kisutch TaxID=8019 RepID=A0A8C7HWB1_ONCKI
MASPWCFTLWNIVHEVLLPLYFRNWQQCQSAGEILSMFSAIKTLYHEGDVCISNAGLAHLESLLNGKTDEAYQSKRERKVDDGHIININKLRGAKTHIQATCISPGMVETEYVFRLHSLHSEKAAATYDSMKVNNNNNNDILEYDYVQMRPVEQVS